MQDVEDRVAVVTGGGRGIGRGIVLELARLGFRLIVNYRGDEDAARECCELAERRGARQALPMKADVADLAQGRELVERAVARFGRLDLWVNNAGVAPEVRADLLEARPESWDRVLGTNLRGPFFLTQAVARAMLDLRPGDQPDPPPRRIVFITSVSSVMASVNRGDYCVAKAGLSMVVQLFAARLADEGILVHEVRPGVIETDMTRAVHAAYSDRIARGLSPIRRWGTPGDVGRAVAAIAEGAFPFSTGDVIHVDGGLHLRTL